MIRLLFLLLLALFAVLAGALLLPSQVVVERSIVVNRPAATVFTLLDGFQTWVAWSPWAELDPAATFEVSGPETGVGARLRWSGDPSIVGVGEQVIVASEPYRLVELNTELGGQGDAIVTYVVEGGGLGSAVTWRFESDVTTGQGLLGGLVGRYYGYFLGRWVSEDLERGLLRLKLFAERLPEGNFAGAPVEVSDMEAIPIAYIDGIEAGDPGMVATGLAVAFAELATWASTAGIVIEGAPLTITRPGLGGGELFIAALPLPDSMIEAPEPGGRVTLGTLPAGEVACILHQGPADETLASYEKLVAWIAAHGWREQGEAWERYVADPGETMDGTATVDICYRVLRTG